MRGKSPQRGARGGAGGARGGAGGARGGAGSAQSKPGQPATLSPKEQLKRAKVNRQRRLTMDFLFRQLATITYRFNLFFNKELTEFSKAMSHGDDLRSQQKLKKSDRPRICNLKTMLEAADLLKSTQQIEEADHLRALADLSGRTRTWGLMASDLQKMTKGGKDAAEISDKMKSLLDSIQSFTNRTVDYSTSKFVYKVDLSEFTELEKKYLTWPVAVRTALFDGAQFMKMASDASGTPLLPESDPTYLLRNMQAAEFVLALNMDDELNERNTEDDKKMKALLGPSAATAKKETWRRPNVDDVEPELLQPIGPRSLLLQFPVAEVSGYTTKQKNKDKRRR